MFHPLDSGKQTSRLGTSILVDCRHVESSDNGKGFVWFFLMQELDAGCGFYLASKRVLPGTANGEGKYGPRTPGSHGFVFPGMKGMNPFLFLF
jgi:hypothetical protein